MKLFSHFSPLQLFRSINGPGSRHLLLTTKTTTTTTTTTMTINVYCRKILGFFIESQTTRNTPCINGIFIIITMCDGVNITIKNINIIVVSNCDYCSGELGASRGVVHGHAPVLKTNRHNKQIAKHVVTIVLLSL